MPPTRGGHDGRAAGHRLQVDDAERLVHRGADEHGGVREELDHVRARQHLRDPVHALAYAAQLLEQVAELPVDLRGVGGARAQHDLRGRVDVPDRAQQMGHALLAGDAADEQDVRAAGVDADAVEHVRAVVRRGRGRCRCRCARRAPWPGPGRGSRPRMSSRMAAETAMTASAASMAVRSAQLDRA